MTSYLVEQKQYRGNQNHFQNITQYIMLIEFELHFFAYSN